MASPSSDYIATLLAHEIVHQVKHLTNNKYRYHLSLMVEGIKFASDLSVEMVNQLAERITDKKLLSRFLVDDIARQFSKKFGRDSHSFATCVVDAALATDDGSYAGDVQDTEYIDTEFLNDDYSMVDLIGITEVPVDSATNFDSYFVDGLAFKTNTPSFINCVSKPKIVPMDIQLDDPKDLNEEREINDIVKKFVESGIQILLSIQAVGDRVTQLFESQGIFCAGLVAEDDLYRVAGAIQNDVISDLDELTSEIFAGTCDVFDVKQVGGELLNVLYGCPSGRTTTIVLRGREQSIAEGASIIPNLVEFVRRSMKNSTVVVRGRAIYTKLKENLLQGQGDIEREAWPYIEAFAKAFEVLASTRNSDDDVSNEPTLKLIDGIQSGANLACSILNPTG